MIVKNEAHVILRSLKSVLPIIDTWVITDTGSTDGTQEIIKNFFKEQNIEGTLIEHPWIDFSDARNVSLNEAEKLGDFGFWIDADEELILRDNFTKEKFLKELEGFHCISLSTSYNTTNYTRKNIWKTGMGYNWTGPIHEFLTAPTESEGNISTCVFVLVKAEGSSWNNITEKYSNHAKILEEYTKINSDPRWIYYTAQSYRDANNLEKAFEWYSKRASIDTGYLEEIYASKYLMAVIQEKINNSNTDLISNLYLNAHLFDSIRAEALGNLIFFLHNNKQYEKAYIFSKYGATYQGKNPYPSRTMFVDHDLYEYKLVELHYLSCFYTNRIQEGSWFYWKQRELLKELKINNLIKKNILNNQQYYPLEEAKKYGYINTEKIVGIKQKEVFKEIKSFLNKKR